MKNSIIRWKKSDYIKLGKAVAKFNRKISELDPNELRYLPSMKNYKELKEEILSRKELNRIVNALRRFDISGMELKVTLPSGEELTKWEYREIKLARNRAIKLRERQIESVLNKEKFMGMGNEKISQYKMSINYMKKLESKSGYNFKEAQKLIEKLGSNQYEMWRAEIYRQNFMSALEEMSNYDFYYKLVEKLNTINNPIKFYEYISKSTTLKDLFLFYKDKATSNTYGGFASNQDAFNDALIKLGLLTNKEVEIKYNQNLEKNGGTLSEFYRRF